MQKKREGDKVGNGSNNASPYRQPTGNERRQTNHAKHAGISATNKAFMEAFGKGDAAGLADLYTKTGSLLPPNSEVVGGIEGIRGFWQGAMDMGIKGAKLETG